jgi:hypothetical protein
MQNNSKKKNIEENDSDSWMPKKLEVEHLKKIKPVCLQGKLEKISGLGFSVNERVLKLDTRSLAYFK